MVNDQIINEMLHYLKTGKHVISSDLNQTLSEAGKLCPFLHGKKTDSSCYVSHPAIQYLVSYLNRYALCFEFLDINIYALNKIRRLITDIERPENNQTLKEFKENLSSIIDEIKDDEKKINEMVLRLTCEECIRLDEAINTYLINSFFSSVIMAVSAVESRFHHLIKNKNKVIYKKYFERATLGQIIQLFDDNSYKESKFKPLKKILPVKYKSLINVLNYYRVFSAHPKSKEISFKTAQSVLNFSFNFLLDSETRIETQLTKCK